MFETSAHHGGCFGNATAIGPQTVARNLRVRRSAPRVTPDSISFFVDSTALIVQPQSSSPCLRVKRRIGTKRNPIPERISPMPAHKPFPLYQVRAAAHPNPDWALGQAIPPTIHAAAPSADQQPPRETNPISEPRPVEGGPLTQPVGFLQEQSHFRCFTFRFIGLAYGKNR